MPVSDTTYTPQRYAFRFPNTFVNTIWSGRVPPFVGRQVALSTAGRCGGMVYASLDFYHLHTPVPTWQPTAAGRFVVPADGHPLADYIYTRQLHSMLTTFNGVRDGVRFMRWSGYSAATVLEKTRVEEHKVIAALDRGQPVVLGLIKATSPKISSQGSNHQVVCYGYQRDATGNLQFRVYDPNEPFTASDPSPYAVTLSLVDDDAYPGFPYQQTRSARVERWRGFFVMRYRPRRPDPKVMTVHTTEAAEDPRGSH